MPFGMSESNSDSELRIAFFRDRVIGVEFTLCELGRCIGIADIVRTERLEVLSVPRGSGCDGES